MLPYLNTSHVSVRVGFGLNFQHCHNNLNTSHVSVRDAFISGNGVGKPNLNTSHVSVRVSMKMNLTLR